MAMNDSDPPKLERRRFQFGIRSMIGAVVAFSLFCFYGSSTGDFFVLPTFAGIILFLAILTRGEILYGAALGALLGLSVILERGEPIALYVGAFGATVCACIHAIALGHRAAGCLILTALAWAVVAMIIWISRLFTHWA